MVQGPSYNSTPIVEPSPEMRVLCVDDSRDIMSVLRMVIDAEPGMRCVGCLTSADGLVEAARQLDATIVVLDASMPGEDPFEALSELASKSPQTRTIVFSAWDNDEFMERAVSSGAWGWVSKGATPDTIVKAVREVAAGGTYFTPSH